METVNPEQTEFLQSLVNPLDPVAVQRAQEQFGGASFLETLGVELPEEGFGRTALGIGAQAITDPFNLFAGGLFRGGLKFLGKQVPLWTQPLVPTLGRVTGATTAARAAGNLLGKPIQAVAERSPLFAKFVEGTRNLPKAFQGGRLPNLEDVERADVTQTLGATNRLTEDLANRYKSAVETFVNEAQRLGVTGVGGLPDDPGRLLINLLEDPAARVRFGFDKDLMPNPNLIPDDVLEELPAHQRNRILKLRESWSELEADLQAGRIRLPQQVPETLRAALHQAAEVFRAIARDETRLGVLSEEALTSLRGPSALQRVQYLTELVDNYRERRAQQLMQQFTQQGMEAGEAARKATAQARAESILVDHIYFPHVPKRANMAAWNAAVAGFDPTDPFTRPRSQPETIEQMIRRHGGVVDENTIYSEPLLPGVARIIRGVHAIEVARFLQERLPRWERTRDYGVMMNQFLMERPDLRLSPAELQDLLPDVERLIAEWSNPSEAAIISAAAKLRADLRDAALVRTRAARLLDEAQEISSRNTPAGTQLRAWLDAKNAELAHAGFAVDHPEYVPRIADLLANDDAALQTLARAHMELQAGRAQRLLQRAAAADPEDVRPIANAGRVRHEFNMWLRDQGLVLWDPSHKPRNFGQIGPFVLPAGVAKDLDRFLKFYDTAESIESFRQWFVNGTKIWRWMVVGPLSVPFWINNMIGDMMNMYLGGFRDWTKLWDAKRVLSGELNTTFIRDASGNEITGRMIRDAAFDNLILRGGFATNETARNAIENARDFLGERWLGKLEKKWQSTEDWRRLALFMDRLQKNLAKPGVTFEEAVRQATAHTKKYLFDYALGLTELEGVIRDYFAPFYAWTRFNLPLQLIELTKQPRTFLNVNRMKQLVAGAVSPEGEDKAEDVPPWLQNAIQLPLSEPLKKAFNNQPVFFNIRMPAEDLGRILEVFTGGEVSRGEFPSMLHPLWRFLIEYWTDHDLFRGEELHKFTGQTVPTQNLISTAAGYALAPLANVATPVAQIPEDASAMETLLAFAGSGENVRVDPFAQNIGRSFGVVSRALGDVLPAATAARRAVAGEPLPSDAARILRGVRALIPGVYTYNPDQRRIERLREYREWLQDRVIKAITEGTPVRGAREIRGY